MRDLPVTATQTSPTQREQGRTEPRGAVVSTLLTFEHPLNERVRTFLRIEHLFERLSHFAPQYDSWATRVAVESLLDIAAVTARADVKNELLKELERNMGTVKRIADQPGVDPKALERVLNDIESAIADVRRLTGPIGQIAREDELLKTVAQRGSIPGGSCSFDLPHFHHWLTQPPDVRQARIEHWLEDLVPAERAIRLVLSLTRTSASPRQALAERGFFQEALDAQAPAQMVRVGINGGGSLYPEISGHKSRFSIRFMESGPRGRPSQSSENVPFKLTCCVF